VLRDFPFHLRDHHEKKGAKLKNEDIESQRLICMGNPCGCPFSDSLLNPRRGLKIRGRCAHFAEQWGMGTVQVPNLRDFNKQERLALMRILSKYILKEFFSFLMYCILAFLAIFILIDVVENLDSMISDKFGFYLIFLYYLFSLPYIIILTLPVSMLLTTMFSLGRLVGDNEITAVKASGVSLYRVLLPLYVFAFFVGLFVMGFTEYVVPTTNRYCEDIKDQGAHFRFSLSRSREMDRAHIFLTNADGSIVYARNYNSERKTAEGVFVISPNEIAETAPADSVYSDISERIDARNMYYSDGVWNLVGVEIRTFDRDGETVEILKTMPAPFITVEPSDFARIDIKPEEMNYFGLRNYISEIRAKGGDASEWLVDLYLKISFPFVSFVIVFFGAPMVAGSTQRGKAASFGIALVICFIYYSLINASQILGRNGSIDPVAAAWFPNGLFFTIGLFMHFRAKK
jgi:lipopolysaccharide export system permease protein